MFAIAKSNKNPKTFWYRNIRLLNVGVYPLDSAIFSGSMGLWEKYS